MEEKPSRVKAHLQSIPQLVHEVGRLAIHRGTRWSRVDTVTRKELKSMPSKKRQMLLRYQLSSFGGGRAGITWPAFKSIFSIDLLYYPLCPPRQNPPPKTQKNILIKWYHFFHSFTPFSRHKLAQTDFHSRFGVASWPSLPKEETRTRRVSSAMEGNQPYSFKFTHISPLRPVVTSTPSAWRASRWH